MIRQCPAPVKEALKAAQPEHRIILMTMIYGEACTMAQAGLLINRSIDTIKDMLEDGRLRPACEGTRVDVRSIAQYIEAPEAADHEMRVRKRRERRGDTCQWHV